jgi:hypothetical protein
MLPPVNWRWVKEGDGYVRHEAWPHTPTVWIATYHALKCCLGMYPAITVIIDHQKLTCLSITNHCLLAVGILRRIKLVINRLLSANESGSHTEHSNLGSRIALALRKFPLILSGVAPYVTTFVDVATDLYLVITILPNKVAFMLLAVMMACDVLSAGTMVLRMYQYQAELGRACSSGQMSPQLTGIGSTCLAIFSVPGLGGKVLRMLLFIVLVPLVSLSMHTIALVLVVVALAVVFRGKGMPQWNFCGLDPVKCAIYRSFLVGWLEAPCAIAFTTFAYLVPKKNIVGTFISNTVFFLSLAISMFHMLLEMWGAKELMIHNGNSIRAAFREISDLRAVMPGAAGTGTATTTKGVGGASGKGHVPKDAIIV